MFSSTTYGENHSHHKLLMTNFNSQGVSLHAYELLELLVFDDSPGLRKIAVVDFCIHRASVLKFHWFVLLLAGMGYIIVSRFVFIV